MTLCIHSILTAIHLDAAQQGGHLLLCLTTQVRSISRQQLHAQQKAPSLGSCQGDPVDQGSRQRLFLLGRPAAAHTRLVAWCHRLREGDPTAVHVNNVEVTA